VTGLRPSVEDWRSELVSVLSFLFQALQGSPVYKNLIFSVFLGVRFSIYKNVLNKNSIRREGRREDVKRNSISNTVVFLGTTLGLSKGSMNLLNETL
jgi:hypothetical protein